MTLQSLKGQWNRPFLVSAQSASFCPAFSQLTQGCVRTLLPRTFPKFRLHWHTEAETGGSFPDECSAFDFCLYLAGKKNSWKYKHCTDPSCYTVCLENHDGGIASVEWLMGLVEGWGYEEEMTRWLIWLFCSQTIRLWLEWRVQVLPLTSPVCSLRQNDSNFEFLIGKMVAMG